MIDRFWKGGSKAMTILGWPPPRLFETHSFLKIIIIKIIIDTIIIDVIIDTIVIDTIVIDTIEIDFLNLVDLVKDVQILNASFIMNINM